MPRPIAAIIRLPDDAGNTGKKVRTQTRVVGADTVHEHFWVQRRKEEILGIYRTTMAQQTVQVSAQNGTTTGFLWILVPSTVSNKRGRIRKVLLSSNNGSALATPTVPRLAFQRFTYTGTPSGAQLALVKNDNASWPNPPSAFDLRLAMTGMTISLVSPPLFTGPLVQAVTAVGIGIPNRIELVRAEDEEEWPVLAPGDGIVVYQDVAGTTADTRKFDLSFLVDEIDVS